MAAGFAEFNLEEFRARLAKMNEAELLRYGQAVRSACSPEANIGKPPDANAILQLGECRKEWRKRHPKLPLSA